MGIALCAAVIIVIAVAFRQRIKAVITGPGSTGVEGDASHPVARPDGHSEDARSRRGGLTATHATGREVGESVVVKPGTKDPESDGDISGWQGRISKIEPWEGGTLVCIVWDSITLQHMPRSLIEHCEEEGFDWQSIYLGVDEVEPAFARDTERDVTRTVQEVRKHAAWFHLGAEGKRIQKVLDGIDPPDTRRLFEVWEAHLEAQLGFPFEAEVVELSQRGTLRLGDRVIVEGLSCVDDPYGIMVAVRRGREHGDFPLCDLQATHRRAAHYQLVRDYVVWYANR